MQTMNDRRIAQARACGFKFFAGAEYRVELPNGGNARFDDFDAAFYANSKNNGMMTGRGRIRPI